jgi:hypothetical protein
VTLRGSVYKEIIAEIIRWNVVLKNASNLDNAFNI